MNEKRQILRKIRENLEKNHTTRANRRNERLETVDEVVQENRIGVRNQNKKRNVSIELK